MIDNEPHKTKAYIAGVNLNDPNFDYYMTELANLTEANNMEVVGQSRQNTEQIVAGEVLLTLIGNRLAVSFGLPTMILAAPLAMIWQAFSVFIGSIQAYVFVTLSMVYIGRKVTKE